ncbi:vanadium-dependent haloperoxidase [Thiothrix subterranea]|uniref:vanadium-dependent haloperoxidase n=1 Tax=Thiothrix subterranea TaxID=2735563 RepID=UPI00280BD20E|nr:vanadium-dependent haloperoxidase [Thiothrix subterranea]
MNLLIEWNNLVLDAIRALGKLPVESKERNRGGPPQIARSLGIIYTIIYDSWFAYDPVANPSIGNPIRCPEPQCTLANKRKAISQAAYRGIIDQFPPSAFSPVCEVKCNSFKDEYQFRLEALLRKEGIMLGDTNTNSDNPVGIANIMADRILQSRHNDFANQDNLYDDTSGYQSVNKPMSVILPATMDAIDFPDRWQSLTYLNIHNVAVSPKFITPHWGGVVPFSLENGQQFRPAPPQLVLSQGFLDQARHVMDIQVKLTPEQKVIAEYWADGPNSELPPGHWTEFAAFVLERDYGGEADADYSIDNSVKLLFLVANAVFDASIATWDAKVAFDYVRPITAIRYLFGGRKILGWAGAGKGIQEIQGETWKPFQVASFPTPPFAEFTSGHSGFSMAAATVLKKFTGSDRFGFFYAQNSPLKADPSEAVTDVVLSWPTFTSAAREAGESRLFGGIHFYEGNVVGLDLGEKVGTQVFNKAYKLWSGS